MKIEKEYRLPFWCMVTGVFMITLSSILDYTMPTEYHMPANVGNSSRYAPKMELMIENTVITDTIYIIVPDQNAYNIGYFDGNSDAYYQFDSINNAYADND